MLRLRYIITLFLILLFSGQSIAQENELGTKDPTKQLQTIEAEQNNESIQQE